VQTISRSDYFLTQLMVIATYLRMMVLPINQNLDYDYPLFHSLLNPEILMALTMHLTLLCGALLMFVRSRNNHGTSSISMRLAALGIFWFYLALMVESSIIPIRDVINEHRLYLPSGGIILFGTALAGWYSACNASRRKILWGVTILCCLTLMTASILRNRVWKNELTMWRDVASKSPNKARAQFNVGFHLSKRFQQEAALPYLVRALEIDPSPQLYWLSINGSISMIKSFDGRSILGFQYQATPDTVKPEFIVPWTALSHNNLGLAYEFLGNLQWARNNFTLATRIDPTLDLAWLNLAIICARQQDRPGYEAAIARLAVLNPPRATALSSLRLFP
jgi:tetratricopeptide (TPR) repeat protein